MSDKQDKPAVMSPTGDITDKPVDKKRDKKPTKAVNPWQKIVATTYPDLPQGIQGRLADRLHSAGFMPDDVQGDPRAERRMANVAISVLNVAASELWVELPTKQTSKDPFWVAIRDQLDTHPDTSFQSFRTSFFDVAGGDGLALAATLSNIGD